MPSSTLTIAPFEYQVVQVLAGMSPSGQDSFVLKYKLSLYDGEILERGQQLFGGTWGGDPVNGSYPVINGALGRLRRKDMVQRSNSGCGWGYWRLSSQARELLGLPIV